MDLVDWIERIPERYRVDKQELGKVLLVASAAAFVVSLHSAFTLDATIQQVDRTNSQFDELEVIMSSQSFNQSMEALESTDTYEQIDIYGQFSTAVDTFQTAEDGLESQEELSEGLDSSYETYQWLVLVSILGIVAGAAIIYI
jgi:hypothetical protein